MAYIVGTDKDDTIEWTDGVTHQSDTIVAGAGDDTVYGLGGNDTLVGGAGADRLDGGTGQDRASYKFSPSGIYVNLEAGRGSGGDAEGDILVSIEDVAGSHHDDLLIGNGGQNFLFGDLGNDTLKGGGGDDWLFGQWGNDIVKGGDGEDGVYGEDGNDSLFGGADNDMLFGGSGNDVLNGGAGYDELSGGADADRFVWSHAGDTGPTAATADFIWDFDFAEGDRIDLGAIDADVYAAGNQAFTFIGDAAFSGTPGEVRYYHAGGDTYIEMQTGTSPDVEGVVRIFGIVTPEAGWFVL
jgi:Ca2+-binding RTX toxin-like protein